MAKFNIVINVTERAPRKDGTGLFDRVKAGAKALAEKFPVSVSVEKVEQIPAEEQVAVEAGVRPFPE